jgi:PIN domain nuclease of toxin-antitoxin system
MPDFVTDTHGLIWYLTNSPRLGSAASAAFDACDQGQALIYVPTICIVEIVFLQEKGRIPNTLKSQFDTAVQLGTSGLKVIELTREIA